MKKLIISILSVAVLSSCQKQDSGEYKPVIDFGKDKKAVELIASDNLFALDLFRGVNALEKESDNFMISPLSVSIALGMTYNGADGETKTAFENALRLTGLSRHEINYIHGALITHLMRVDPKVTVEIANSIWVNQFYTLLQEFADSNRYYYDAEINSLNFKAPGSVDLINHWVSDKTHEKITEVLDEIPPDAVMYLINALYYYGSWKYEFDKKDNLPIQFRRGEDSYKEVEGMRIEADLPYLDKGNFRIAELPYGDDKFSMMILLPGEGSGIEDIIDDLNIENWNGWIEDMYSSKLALHMPKFTFEYKTLLNDALKNMGLGVAFSGSAEFPLMVEESKNLNISRVIHKTFVDVNEKGTEAAAVTVVEIRETSAGPGDSPVSFIVDNPFLFIIREKTSNAIVFMGKVENPGYK